MTNAECRIRTTEDSEPWRVFGNTQLISIFPCPSFDISAIRYVWFGRFDTQFKGMGDGGVRMAQFEAYAAEDALDVEDLLNTKDDGGIKLDT